MNGARGRNDGKPIHLCPIDLHKLYAFQHKTLRNLSFDIENRYKKLFEFYSSNKGFEADALWVKQLLDKCFEVSIALPTSLTPTPTLSTMTQEESVQQNGEKKGGAAIRISVCKKGTSNKKLIVVGDWEELLTVGAMKLKLKTRSNKKVSVFNGKGEPLHSFSQLQEDDVIYFSS